VELVSIIIPGYNPGAWLLDAVASAQVQTHGEIETILVNDGTDNAESLHYMHAAASKVDVYLEQPNRGLPAARNAGFGAARGRYVVPLDADDLLDPTYVAECLSALQAAPQAAFAYTSCRVFGDQDYIEPIGDYNLYQLLDRNNLTYAALIRKQDWEELGGYDESMRAGYEDWEFWLRAGSRNRFGMHVPRVLFRYRKHGASLYDVALSRHAEISAYIRGRHPELYEYEARARIKARWSPAVCIVSNTRPNSQSIEDIEVTIAGDPRGPIERSHAPAILVPGPTPVDAESAELAALAVWCGEVKRTLPDGSLALSRRAALKAKSIEGSPRADRQPRASGSGARSWGIWYRHLLNAELFSWAAWVSHPLRSALRLIPLAVKERINTAVRRPVFDLSFYLKFRPGLLAVGNALIEPLCYFPKPSAGRFRIAMITPHLGPGGAETILMDIAAALSRDRFEILLLATQSLDSSWLGRWRDYAGYVYDLARAVPTERTPEAILAVVANWKCDAVLVQNSLPGYAALSHIKRAFPGIRTIDLIHALDDQWDQVSVTAGVAAFIDLRVAVSQAVGERLLASGTPKERIRIVRNGIDLDRFRVAPLRPATDPRQILFAGRLDPVKRPLLLVEIAERLAALRKESDFRVVVAGDGPESGSLRKAAGRSVAGHLFDFRGHVDDIVPLIADCDLCVLPSRAEGTPMIVLESLACSRPVVASNVGAVGEVLDSTCGVLIDVQGDEGGEFAAAINRLLDRPDLREQMGTAGRRKVEAGFDRRRAREAYLRLFDG
jgi:glycosyltransferase involved in cell wall biosynthesis